MTSRLLSNVLTALGLLLIAAALSLVAYNVHEGQRAGDEAAAAAAELAEYAQFETEAGAAPSAPSYTAETPMPVMEAKGHLYVGTLRIPELGLELPIMSEWSYPNLTIAPCLYAGSAYAGNMVIAAHNYSTHFGGLRDLPYGAEVSFVDVLGNVFVYRVASIETLAPTAVDEMTQSDWALTLFTCTLGGAERVTVRCDAVPLM